MLKKTLFENVYRVSNVGRCMRELYFTHYHVKAPISKELQIIFDEGQKIHEEEQKKTKEIHGKYCELEREVHIKPSAELDIIGHVDIYLRGFPLVVEIKSCAKLPTKPLAQHVQQTLLYMCGLNTKYGEIRYIQKGVIDVRKEYLINYSDSQVLEAIGFFEKLYFSIAQREIPDCSCIYEQSFYCQQFMEGLVS